MKRMIVYRGMKLFEKLRKKAVVVWWINKILSYIFLGIGIDCKQETCNSPVICKYCLIVNTERFKEVFGKIRIKIFTQKMNQTEYMNFTKWF